MSEPSLPSWARQAVRDMGWRDLALAVVIQFVWGALGPLGGTFLFGDRSAHFDLGKYLLSLGRDTLGFGLPVVFTVRVADLAIADGVPPWRAYSTVLVAVAAWSQAATLFFGFVLGADVRGRWPAVKLYMFLRHLLHGSIGLVIYARWRATQRAVRQVQANETERARNAQRLQAARLLALQARVEPQLLFDSLARVGVLQRQAPAAADTLLADLIALLRAMLPSAASTSSSLEREFAVVDAWLRVTRAVSGRGPSVQLRPGPGTEAASLAPMLALPLLRAVVEASDGRTSNWRLGAEAAAGRLLVSLEPRDGARDETVADLADADFAALRERLALLHGDNARLWISAAPPRVTLDLPLESADADESSPAR